MTRPARVFVEGDFYHVYRRLGRGERVFAAEHEAAEFTRTLKEVADRDDLRSWRGACFQTTTICSKVSVLLGLDEQDLRSSGRAVELLEVRELLIRLGVERYRLKVKELAECVRKWPDGMSQALARGALRRRAQDADFRSRLSNLDHAVAQAIANPTNNAIA